VIRIVALAVSAVVGLFTGAWLGGGRPARPPGPSPARVRVAFDPAVRVAEVDERFLSFAVDTAEVVGGEFWAPPGGGHGLLETRAVDAYDFDRPALRRLAGALAPAYLRIGGTDADRTVYRLDDGAPGAPTAGARWVLTRRRWDAVNEFARAVGLRIMFTLNAGPSARAADGAWDPAGARALIAYSLLHADPVDVWELGNEVNLYPLAHGRWVSADRYADDLARARALLDELHAPARLAGVGSAFFPGVGEGRAFTDGVLRRAGRFLDVVTWHYYPQQSRRCPIANRRALPGQPLGADDLDEVDRWAAEVEGAARARAPGAAVWLGETGSAQCGGEPGFSNTFADTLWWLDELGRLARRGERVAVRQTLSGSDYGLVDDRTLEPNPSYWASWLWHDLMGTRVLDAAVWPASASLRAYAHCLRPGADRPAGGAALLLINVDPAAGVDVDLPDLAGATRVLRLEADGPAARTTRLDGAALQVQPDGQMPARPRLDDVGAMTSQGTTLTVAPLSVAFVVLPYAGAAACR
jgi:heparanase 1